MNILTDFYFDFGNKTKKEGHNNPIVFHPSSERVKEKDCSLVNTFFHDVCLEFENTVQFRVL